ncbi:MAG: histidine kinase [Bacteroidia bacterium]|nr:histidine kinase [Bacteroidia bacterium]
MQIKHPKLRNHHLLHLGILFSVLLSAISLRAQQFNLQTFNVSAGLAQSQVYAMLEDQRGYLWFGTWGGGLSRYDGTSFRTFNARDGLTHNYIHSLYEDHQGNIWIGTDKGVSKYDGRKFTNFPGENKLSWLRINSITEDNQGRLCFGTQQGAIIYNPQTGEQILLNKESGLPHGLVFAFIQDQKGQYWVGTDGGLCVFAATVQNGDQPLVTFLGKQGLASLQVRSLLEDSKSRIWISTYGGGISMFDPRRYAITHHAPFDNLTTLDGLPSSIVTCSMEDKAGNLWFGTIYGGACRYDGKFFSYFTEEDGMRSSLVHALLEDSWGNIWFGTSGGGVSKFVGEQFVHFTERNGIKGNRVYSVVEDQEGYIWMGTSGKGITRYNGREFVRFGAEEGFKDVLVKALEVDTAGRIWIGSEGGGLALKQGDKFRFFGQESGISSSFIRDIHRTRKGEIWIATAGGGICRHDSSGFTCYNKDDGLPGDRINCIIDAPDGTLLVGTDGIGLSRFDPVAARSGKPAFTNLGTSSGLCSNIIRSFSYGSNGTIWAGTAEGLVRIDPGGNLTCMGEAEGLNSSNIYLTVMDNAGNLWAGSEKGVDKIGLNAEGVITEVNAFGRTEGFGGIETCRGASAIDSYGRLWFGTIDGITQYNPREEEFNPMPPKIQITGIDLFYEKIEQTGFADSLTPWHPLPVKLNLPWNQNHLSFEFIGINHKNQPKVRYRWRLAGYEEEWSPASSKTEATYSNLHPENYTFEVMAGNEDGVWNENPATFSFTIEPPFWGTWTFRILATALLILLVVVFFQLRIRQIKKRTEARQKEIEQEKNLLELEQKALRLQMNPHFIFNALNSIKGLIASNDQAAARKNLVNFARLMRLILDNSREAYIPLSKEVQTLQYYLDLEKLSRGDKFDYAIDLAKDLDPETVSIPPMLVQPFVENAVLHGISPLKEGGMINIAFSKAGNALECSIRDNGVGRKKSGEIQKGREKLHISRGVSVTEERLNLLCESESDHFGIRILDLTNENGEPAGTEVTVNMPFK